MRTAIIFTTAPLSAIAIALSRLCGDPDEGGASREWIFEGRIWIGATDEPDWWELGGEETERDVRRILGDGTLAVVWGDLSTAQPVDVQAVEFIRCIGALGSIVVYGDFDERPWRLDEIEAAATSTQPKFPWSWPPRAADQ